MDCQADWANVVLNIRRQDGSGFEILYAAVSDFTRLYSSRAMPSELGDDLHEILLAVVRAIQAGELRDPERMMGFIRTVARRRAVARIRGNIAQRRRFVAHAEYAASRDPSPEDRAAHRERIGKALRSLDRLHVRDREILVRFYLREQLPRQICSEMRLTPTQFRLYKSRALARCAELSLP